MPQLHVQKKCLMKCLEDTSKKNRLGLILEQYGWVKVDNLGVAQWVVFVWEKINAHFLLALTMGTVC